MKIPLVQVPEEEAITSNLRESRENLNISLIFDILKYKLLYACINVTYVSLHIIHVMFIIHYTYNV